MKKARRKFINFLIGGGLMGWVASMLYPTFSFLKPPTVPEPNVLSVKAARTDEIPSNSGRIVRLGRQPVILTRTDTGEFRAFSAVCTHLDCIVQYRPELKHIWCACHDGHYDMQGNNIAGPPPRPLTRYPVTIVDDEVIVSRPGTA